MAAHIAEQWSIVAPVSAHMTETRATVHRAHQQHRANRRRNRFEQLLCIALGTASMDETVWCLRYGSTANMNEKVIDLVNNKHWFDAQVGRVWIGICPNVSRMIHGCWVAAGSDGYIDTKMLMHRVMSKYSTRACASRETRLTLFLWQTTSS